jgi:PDZ domain
LLEWLTPVFIIIAIGVFSLACWTSARVLGLSAPVSRAGRWWQHVTAVFAGMAACWLIVVALAAAIYFAIGVPTRGPPRIMGIFPRTPADRAGVRSGDVLRAVDGHPVVPSWRPTVAVEGDPHWPIALDEVPSIVEGANGRAVEVHVLRGQTQLRFTLQPEDGHIGISLGEPEIFAPGLGRALLSAVKYPILVAGAEIDLVRNWRRPKGPNTVTGLTNQERLGRPLPLRILAAVAAPMVLASVLGGVVLLILSLLRAIIS